MAMTMNEQCYFVDRLERFEAGNCGRISVCPCVPPLLVVVVVVFVVEADVVGMVGLMRFESGNRGRRPPRARLPLLVVVVAGIVSMSIFLWHFSDAVC